MIDDTYNPILLSDYRLFVGAEDYDISSREIFDCIIEQGLREDMRVLDVGCGSLRVGRWLIAFLQSGNYTGVEPETSMLHLGVRHNMPIHLMRYKRPTFLHNADFQIEGDFDFGIAWNVFIHCGKGQFQQFLTGCSAKTWLLTAAVDEVERVWPKETHKASYSYRHASHSGWRYTQDDFVNLCGSAGYIPTKIRYCGDCSFVWRLDRSNE